MFNVFVWYRIYGLCKYYYDTSGRATIQCTCQNNSDIVSVVVLKGTIVFSWILLDMDILLIGC